MNPRQTGQPKKGPAVADVDKLNLTSEATMLGGSPFGRRRKKFVKRFS